jgi:hypothetical protein
MKRIGIPFGIGLLWTAVALCAAADNEPYEIHSQVFWVRGSLAGEATLGEEIWAGDRSRYRDLQKVLTFFTTAQFQVGDDRLVIDDKGWFWNGKKFNDNETEWTLPSEVAHALVVPPIEVLEGKTANITMQSDQEIEYFEKQTADTFTLKKLSEPTGLKIAIRPEKQENGRILLSELNISLRVIEKREPIPGVGLPVGRPILETRDYAAAPIAVRPGKDYGILLNLGQSQGVLIFRFRIQPAGGEAQNRTADISKGA